ncbi:MAG TPA: hypothetical protein H9735_10545 [Candidatus Anaerostipes excrementavium]|uniref:Prenylated flavin chaperone LpdD-like domain-containing protein n=1 Tax=Candidatus Anaerostipes excrementavium TaxID=2838463 RepID=A0A9D1WWZ4_9FIRM|nr:hypothetical protein [uncultured Anaerostipes sp.]HIX68541.1 hypothetical protein [Candidatus Anaerostipes excrementavium]
MGRTIEEKVIEKELSFAKLTVKISRIGEDYEITIQGGEKPHIGCVVLAVPRPSLEENGKRSSTSSVLNVTGHKDEVLCRYLAEQTAAKENAVTVCCGGFHMDHITKEQIKEVKQAVKEMVHLL